jgi:hypothetical protein
MLTMADERATPTPAVRQPGEWQCPRCRRYLGRVVGGILHEPNGDRSVLPCVRHCKRCGKRNVRLQ